MGDLFPEVMPTPEDNDKRYSTLELMAHAERITGVKVNEWHLDVAADEEAHMAPTWYGLKDGQGCIGIDGLRQPWIPFAPYQGRWHVWANVPFSDPRAWLEKAWEEWFCALAGSADYPIICMVLPSDRTDKDWWQELVEPFRDGRGRDHRAGLAVHHLPDRIRYGHPGNRAANGVGQPMFGTSLLVWRRA